MKVEYRDKVKENANDLWTEVWLIFRKPFFFLLSGCILWFGIIKPLTNRVSLDVGIIQYEWFEQQYADIQAIDQQIKDAKESIFSFTDRLPQERKEWSKEDRNELNRLSSIFDGLKQYKHTQVATYNARSKMITRSLWKSKLPHSL